MTRPDRPHVMAGAAQILGAPAPAVPLRPGEPAAPVPAASLLRALFDAAVAAAQPALRVPPYLADLALRMPDDTPLTVIGAGKASAAMALAVEQNWRGPLRGLVVTRYGYGAPCRRIEIAEAGHPVPDDAGQAAARRLLDLAASLTAEDHVLCLISGGGSALLPLPLPGVTLAELQDISRALLASGASITEINTLRRHLSAIKGGRLAAACHPARLTTLLISDVPGDHLPDIASGPTVADATTCADALAIVARHRISLPTAARALLESGAGESIKPGDPRLAHSRAELIAAPQQSLQAAAEVARAAGYAPHILSDAIEGEARDVGKVLAALALACAQDRGAFRRPCALLSGGETTVTVRGQGRGGRNVECLLAFALATHGALGIHALMGDTDGVDGAAEIAGAWLGPRTLERAHGAGLDPQAALAANDAHTFFRRLGQSVVTGPTQTNVNDFRAILID